MVNSSYQLNSDFKKAQPQQSSRLLHGHDWQAFAKWCEVSSARLDVHLGHKSPDDWKADLEKTDLKYFASFEGQEIIGLGRISPAFLDETEWEAIIEISLLHRNKGIGTQLCKAMMDYMTFHHPDKQMTANIAKNNLASLCVAEKAGLTKIGDILATEKSAYVTYKSQSSPGALGIR